MILKLEELIPHGKVVPAEVPSFDEINRCIREKLKILLIKYFRYCYNTSLVDAKDTIERAMSCDDSAYSTLSLFGPIWKSYGIHNEITKGDLMYVLLGKIEFALLNREKLGLTNEQVIELITNIAKTHLGVKN